MERSQNTIGGFPGGAQGGALCGLIHPERGYEVPKKGSTRGASFDRDDLTKLSSMRIGRKARRKGLEVLLGDIGGRGAIKLREVGSSRKTFRKSSNQNCGKKGLYWRGEEDPRPERDTIKKTRNPSGRLKGTKDQTPWASAQFSLKGTSVARGRRE